MTITTTKKLIRLTLTAAFAVGVGLAGIPDAEACGGGWWPEEELIDYRVHGVAQAEKALEAGKYEAAAGSILRMIPHIEGYTALNTSDPIIHRAMRVLAVATARTNGKMNIENQIPAKLKGWAGAESEQAEANLLTAVAMMRKVAEVKKNDAIVESELGETMAKLDVHQAEGKAMLETLAEKDLLSSPEAFKVLAGLRGQDGDAAGKAAALKRCKQMAKNAEFCDASDAAHS